MERTDFYILPEFPEACKTADKLVFIFLYMLRVMRCPLIVVNSLLVHFIAKYPDICLVTAAILDDLYYAEIAVHHGSKSVEFSFRKALEHRSEKISKFLLDLGMKNWIRYDATPRVQNLIYESTIGPDRIREIVAKLGQDDHFEILKNFIRFSDEATKIIISKRLFVDSLRLQKDVLFNIFLDNGVKFDITLYIRYCVSHYCPSQLKWLESMGHSFDWEFLYLVFFNNGYQDLADYALAKIPNPDWKKLAIMTVLNEDTCSLEKSFIFLANKLKENSPAEFKDFANRALENFTKIDWHPDIAEFLLGEAQRDDHIRSILDFAVLCDSELAIVAMRKLSCNPNSVMLVTAKYARISIARQMIDMGATNFDDCIGIAFQMMVADVIPIEPMSYEEFIDFMTLEKSKRTSI